MCIKVLKQWNDLQSIACVHVGLQIFTRGAIWSLGAMQCLGQESFYLVSHSLLWKRYAQWLRLLQVGHAQTMLVNGRDSAHAWVHTYAWSKLHMWSLHVKLSYSTLVYSHSRCLACQQIVTNPAVIHSLCAMTWINNLEIMFWFYICASLLLHTLDSKWQTKLQLLLLWWKNSFVNCPMIWTNDAEKGMKLK